MDSTQQSPNIFTYRHLISGHILLIKEVNTLHFLTSIVSPGWGTRQDHRSHWGSLPRATGTKVSCSKQTDLKEPCVRCARLCSALAIGATKSNGDVTALLFFTSFQKSCGQLPVNNRLCLVLPGTQLMPTSKVSRFHKHVNFFQAKRSVTTTSDTKETGTSSH